MVYFFGKVKLIGLNAASVKYYSKFIQILKDYCYQEYSSLIAVQHFNDKNVLNENVLKENELSVQLIIKVLRYHW